MFDWRNQTPIYDPALSGAGLLAQGRLFRIGNSHLSQNFIAPHWHDSYELGYARQGSGLIVMGRREYAIQTGQVYIINDMEPHMGYADDETAVLFVVHFHPDLLDHGWVRHITRHAQLPFLPHSGFQGPLIPLDDPVTEPVRALLQMIEHEALAAAPAWELVVGGLITQIAGLLIRRLVSLSPITIDSNLRRQALRRISPILHLIEMRYAEPLSLAEMAEAGHLSKSHCCALFRAAFDTTPIAYRNARRLAEARRLLQYTDMTVTEIAYAVGFSSVQELNRLFKRQYGMTPGAVRGEPNQTIRS